MNDPRDTTDQDRAIVRRQFDTEQDEPATAVAETVASLEHRESTDLTTMYDCIDHVLEHVFSNPPSPEAQVQVTFTYEGYRITVDQDGGARFVRVAPDD
jgi:hypothetical protein